MMSQYRKRAPEKEDVRPEHILNATYNPEDLYSVVIYQLPESINVDTIEAKIYIKDDNGEFVKSDRGTYHSEYLDDTKLEEMPIHPVARFCTRGNIYNELQRIPDPHRNRYNNGSSTTPLNALKRLINSKPTVFFWHDGDSDPGCEFNGLHIHLVVACRGLASHRTYQDTRSVFKNIGTVMKTNTVKSFKCLSKYLSTAPRVVLGCNNQQMIDDIMGFKNDITSQEDTGTFDMGVETDTMVAETSSASNKIKERMRGTMSREETDMIRQKRLQLELRQQEEEPLDFASCFAKKKQKEKMKPTKTSDKVETYKLFMERYDTTSPQEIQSKVLQENNEDEKMEWRILNTCNQIRLIREQALAERIAEKKQANLNYTDFIINNEAKPEKYVHHSAPCMLSITDTAKKMSVPGKLLATYPLLETFKYCEKLKCYVDNLDGLDPEIPGPHPPPNKKVDIFDPSQYEEVDTRAITAPEKYHKQTLRDLVKYLTAGYEDDLSKIRVIYRWITCQPIDTLPLKKQPSQGHAVYQLWRIKTKKGNYAQLVSLLCRYAHIPCVIIHGTLKGSTYEVGDTIDEDKHYGEWNAVLINKHWRFINAYWGTCAESAQCDGGEDTETALQYVCDENYFLADPDQVAATHHPANSVWQLKRKPLSMAEFEKMTFVKDRYFNLKLKTLSHPECIVTNGTGELEIKFHIPRQTSLNLDFQYLMFQLNGTSEKRIDRYVYIHRTNNNETLCVKIRAPEVGTYRFELVGKDSTVKDPGYDYDWIAIYKLIFTESMYDCQPYPPTPVIGWGPGRETEKAGLVPLSHFTGEVEMDVHGKAEIKFGQTSERKTTDTSYGAKVYTGGETMNEIPDSAVHRVENGDVVFNVTTPDTGEYVVRLYGKEAEQPKAKEFCDYLLLSKQKDNNGKFPKGFQMSKLGAKSPGFAASGLVPTIASGYIKSDTNEVDIGFTRKEDIEMSVNLSGEKVKPADAPLLLSQTEYGNMVTYNVRLPESGLYGVKVKGTREEGATHKPLYDYVIDYNEPKKRSREGPTIKEQVEQEAKAEEKGALDEVSVEDSDKEEDSEDEGNGIDQGIPNAIGLAENMNHPDVLRRRMRLAIEERDPDELKCVLQDMRNLKLASLEPDIREGESLMASVKLKRELLIAIREKDARKLKIALKKVRTVGVSTLQLEREVEIAVNLLERLKKLQKLLHAIMDLDNSTIMEIRGYSKPPPIVHTVMVSTLLLLGHWKDETRKWKSIQTLLGKTGRDSLKRQIEDFKIEDCPLEVAMGAKDSLCEYSIDQVRLVSAGCATFFVWVKGVIEELERRAGEELKHIQPMTSRRKKRNLKQEMTYLRTLRSPSVGRNSAVPPETPSVLV